MYKNILQTITNVEIYPIISLFIFMLFFSGMLVWAFQVKNDYLKAMASLPLEASGNDAAQAQEEN